jgi:hypothetical protein
MTCALKRYVEAPSIRVLLDGVAQAPLAHVHHVRRADPPRRLKTKIVPGRAGDNGLYPLRHEEFQAKQTDGSRS